MKPGGSIARHERLAAAIFAALSVILLAIILGIVTRPNAAGSSNTAGVVTIQTDQCWQGSIGSLSAGQHSVDGCGAQTLRVPTSTNDSLSAFVQLKTESGNLSVSVNCGSGPKVQTTNAAYGAVLVTCRR